MHAHKALFDDRINNRLNISLYTHYELSLCGTLINKRKEKFSIQVREKRINLNAQKSETNKIA